MSADQATPAIADYGLIGDCHSAALVSKQGSIDWCCLPRFDSGSCFGRLLDQERGGYCAVSLVGIKPGESSRSYVGDSLILETLLHGPSGVVKVSDFFAMRDDGAADPRRELVRIVECERGSAQVLVEIAPRFDYGAVRPWLRRATGGAFTAIGGDDGLVVWSDAEISSDGQQLEIATQLSAGQRLRLLIRFVRPHLIEREQLEELDQAAIESRLTETASWWKRWGERVARTGFDGTEVMRSALTLKALTYAPTGAIVAAPTTSLPETVARERNWDYRYSWVRDSTLAAHALSELGCEREARRFRQFIVRSSAGHAEDLQILFGIGGERRIVEQELDLDGYRGSRPVRIGNGATDQLQLDAYGEILNLAWRWHRRGHSPDDDEWRFFSELVETVVERWAEPDRGIWEWRGEPRHFVHSKACCWVAVDRGLRLADECMRKVPTRRWRQARDQIRTTIETRGYDQERGIFRQCFDEPQLDAALLLLPVMGFLEFDDERMLRTTDAVADELDAGGFLYRYRGDDGLAGQEGAFLACSFWLAECYARQGRVPEARAVFDRATGAGGELGLFSEEIDPQSGELLGNYPQGLTHLSHVAAAVALSQAGEAVTGSAG